MARTKAVLYVSVVVVVAGIVLAVFFPEATQRFFFNAVFSAYKLKHAYILKDNTHLSAGALAFEDLFRAIPISYDIPTMRKEIERMSALAPFPSGITISEVSLRDNLKGYWVTPAGVDEENCAVVLYFHGGAFVSGSAGSHLWFVAELAHRIKGRAFFVEYGLAPEHILPSQTNECVFAYKWLVNSQNISPKRIAMVGDSAGGGLVILSVLALSQQGLAPPAAAVTLSAWTDLVTSPEGRPSYQTNKEKEAMLTKEWLLHQAAHTTGTKLEEYEKRKSPKFSPIYASFEGVKFPSLLMQVGTAEILRDDTVHLAGKVKQAGVDVKLEEYEGLQHNTAMGFALFEEANKALDSIVAFIVSHTSTK